MTPTPDPILLERQKQHFRFESWQNRNRLESELFIKNFLVQGTEMPGWSVHRSQSIRLPQWPTSQRVLWRPAQLATRAPLRSTYGAEPLLHLDLFECASRQKAHEFLVRLLGEFQLPGLSLRDDTPAGDVLFGDPGNQVAVFARGNLALLLRNSGFSPLPIGAATLSLDQSLTRRPESPLLTATRTTRAGQPTARRVALGSKTPLPLPTQAAVEVRSMVAEAGPQAVVPVQPMLKIFTERGELLEEDGKIVYHATAPGAQELVIFTIFSEGNVASSNLRFSVAE